MKTVYQSNLQFWAITAICFSLCLVTASVAAQAQSAIPDDWQARCYQVGIAHNKGLDYVFDYLKKAGAGRTSKMKREDGFDEKNKKEELEGFIRDEFRKASKRADTQDLMTENNSKELLSKMTERQKEIMADVFAVTSDLSLDLKPSLERLDSVELRAKRICNREELLLILSAISVGKHSMQYWHDNYEKWMAELGSEDVFESEKEEIKTALREDTIKDTEAKKGKDKKAKKKWFRWKKVVAMDVLGGVGRSLFALSSLPFSWGAVGIASLIFSAAEVLMESLDCFLP